MYLVVGLGNPGNEYKMTRHNIGFETIDYIAVKNRVKVNKLKFKGVYGETNIGGETSPCSLRLKYQGIY